MANRSSNTAAVPEAKGALDKFKFEVASEANSACRSVMATTVT
nr:small, acid-soluble spore protein, alpha/beta type [Blautia sp. OF11-22]